MSTPTDTPTGTPTCTTCNRRPTPAGTLACQPCRHRTARHLAYIAANLPRLDPTPGANGTDPTAARGAPGFTSRSPARDDVIDLTDRRRGGHDPEQAGNAPVLVVLAWWADQARDAGVLRSRHPLARWAGPPWRLPDPAPRTAVGEADALAGAVEQLAALWWFDGLARAVEQLAARVRRALFEHEHTVPLGRCPLTGSDGEPCGGEIRARLPGDDATCRRCRSAWSGVDELRALGADLGDATLDLPGIARWLAVDSLATLRSWAHRDRWRRERVGRRTLYALEDARASWWAAWDRRHPVHGPALAPPAGPPAPPGWVVDDAGRSVPPPADGHPRDEHEEGTAA